MKLADIIQSEEQFEPETIRRLFPKLGEKGFNNLMAMVTINKTNAAFEDYDVFENVVRALNGAPVKFLEQQGVLTKWIWYALKIFRQLRPKQEFSDEVKEYVKFISNEEGIYIYPPELEVFNATLDEEHVLNIAYNGPFPLTDSTVEEIQASKYLAIQTYIETKSN